MLSEIKWYYDDSVPEISSGAGAAFNHRRHDFSGASSESAFADTEDGNLCVVGLRMVVWKSDLQKRPNLGRFQASKVVNQETPYWRFCLRGVYVGVCAAPENPELCNALQFLRRAAVAACWS